ncbi:MAG: asparagine synthase-related protein, partial [bacterium]
MSKLQYIEKVVDLTDPTQNIIYNMSLEEAKDRLKSANPKSVRDIDGQFALVAVEGKKVYLARSIGRPLRYFIAKQKDGPCLIVAHRIHQILNFLKRQGLEDQFHPSYTRMAPAHYVTKIELLGCPDPNPTYHRFFEPRRNTLPQDVEKIGTFYMQTLYNEIVKWLVNRAKDGPIGVCFSGGIDSGSVFLLTYHALLEQGLNPSRLKAFTLAIDGGGEDLQQSRRFLEQVGLGMFLEPIEVASSDVSWQEAIGVVEDYKPLDIQAATMTLALCHGIRKNYPDWRFLIDGDGGDENLKDYPIEENPELTIRSVLNNTM